MDEEEIEVLIEAIKDITKDYLKMELEAFKESIKDYEKSMLKME